MMELYKGADYLKHCTGVGEAVVLVLHWDPEHTQC